MYLKDPKNNEPSVSLTITLATYLPLLVLSIKLALEGNIDPLTNLFFATAALYFGRRINYNKKILSEDKKSEKEQKSE
jgi:hypothetical protein